MLEKMASTIRENPELAQTLRNPEEVKGQELRHRLNEFIDAFGDQFRPMAQSTQQRDAVIKIVLEIASQPPRTEQFRPKNVDRLKNNFLSLFHGEQRAEASELLDLGRASYRLRDDDNVYLGRIEGQQRSHWTRRDGESRKGSRSSPKNSTPRNWSKGFRTPVMFRKDPPPQPTRSKPITS
jgi:pyruvate,water dikinase